MTQHIKSTISYREQACLVNFDIQLKQCAL